MGIAEAKKYIQELHRKQDNPYLWPDYLTGLPDKAAIIKKLDEVFPKMGEYAVVYVRIANIHPYLIKYGPDRHAEVIQWAAAILKTSAQNCAKGFVGTLSTHDFIAICKAKNIPVLFREAGKLFSKKVATFYTQQDREKGTILSFNKPGGEIVRVGLMRLIAVIANTQLNTKKSHLIKDMGKVCESIEGTDQDIVVMTDEMVCRD